VHALALIRPGLRAATTLEQALLGRKQVQTFAVTQRIPARLASAASGLF
jgi:hypothetical protein